MGAEGRSEMRFPRSELGREGRSNIVGKPVKLGIDPWG